MPGKKFSKHVNLKKPEKIIGKRCQNGCPEVLVKWQGYADKYSTWEPLLKMGHCIQLISDYEASVYLKAQKTHNAIVEKSNILSRKVSTLSESSEDEDDEKPLSQLKVQIGKINSSNKELFTISSSSEDEDEDEDEQLPEPNLQLENDDEQGSTSSRSSSSTTSTSSSSSFNFSSISSSSSCSSLSPETTTIDDSIDMASKRTVADLFSPDVGLTKMTIESCINPSKEQELKSLTQYSESQVIMNQNNIRRSYELQLQRGQSNPTTLANECDLSNPKFNLPFVQPITQSNQNELNNIKNRKKDFNLCCEPHYYTPKLQSMPDLEKSEPILALPPQTKINTFESIFDINKNNKNTTQNLRQKSQTKSKCGLISTVQSVIKSNENGLNNIKVREPSLCLLQESQYYSKQLQSMPDLKDNEQMMSLPHQQIGELSKVNINQNKIGTTQLDLPQDPSQQLPSESNISQFVLNESMSSIRKPRVTKSNKNETNNKKRGRPFNTHHVTQYYNQKMQSKPDVEENLRLLGLLQQRKICKKTSEINVKINHSQINNIQTKINTPTVPSNTKKEENETNNVKIKRRLSSSCHEPHEQNGLFFSLPKIPKPANQFKGKKCNNKMGPISSDSLLSPHKSKDHQLQICTSCLNQNIKQQSTAVASTLNPQIIGNTRSPSKKASSSGSVANSSKFDSWRVPLIKRKGPYGMQRGLELDKVIHHFFVDDKLFLFVKWVGKTETDAVLIDSIRDSYPIPIINYFEKLEIYCDFNTNKF